MKKSYEEKLNGLREASLATYTDGNNNRIAVGDTVTFNPAKLAGGKNIGKKFKILKLAGDDADLIGTGSHNKG